AGEPLDQIRIVESRDKQDLEVRLLRTETLSQDGTGQVRHNHIRQQQLNGFSERFVGLDRLPTAICGEHTIPRGTHHLIEQVQDHVVVVDSQNSWRRDLRVGGGRHSVFLSIDVYMNARLPGRTRNPQMAPLWHHYSTL